jgi:hypothetical protein
MKGIRMRSLGKQNTVLGIDEEPGSLCELDWGFKHIRRIH